MSLLDREVTATSDDDAVTPATPTTRRAWRVGVVAVLGLVLGWALLPFGVRLGQDVAPGLPVDAGLLVGEYGEDGMYGLRYQHHAEVTLRLPIRNRGPLPLRITAAGIDDGRYPLLVPRGDGNLPLTIGPWESAELEMPFTFDNCRYYHERSAETYDKVSLEGSVLGRGFEEDVAFDYPVVLHGQVILDCPDRTLIRSDDHPLRR